MSSPTNSPGEDVDENSSRQSKKSKIISGRSSKQEMFHFRNEKVVDVSIKGVSYCKWNNS